jgi:hypothetical protein
MGWDETGIHGLAFPRVHAALDHVAWWYSPPPRSTTSILHATNSSAATDALLATNASETAPWCPVFISYDCPTNTLLEISRLNWPGTSFMYKKLTVLPWVSVWPCSYLALVFTLVVVRSKFCFSLSFYPPLMFINLLDYCSSALKLVDVLPPLILPDFRWILRATHSRPTDVSTKVSCSLSGCPPEAK